MGRRWERHCSRWVDLPFDVHEACSSSEAVDALEALHDPSPFRCFLTFIIAARIPIYMEVQGCAAHGLGCRRLCRMRGCWSESCLVNRHRSRGEQEQSSLGIPTIILYDIYVHVPYRTVPVPNVGTYVGS